MGPEHIAIIFGVLFAVFSPASGCQYCGCYGTPNCDCYCPPWMYIGYDRIILEPARGQVSVSSSAAASVKYNKGAPQAYISSLSSAKADPKIPVNIVGGGPTPPVPQPEGISTPPRPPPVISSPPPNVVTPTKPVPPNPNAQSKPLWDYHASDKANPALVPSCRKGSYAPESFGPQNWEKLTPKCAGRRQSPIDIVTANAVPKPWPIKLSAATADAATAQSLIVKGKLKNNGRAIGFTVDKVASPVKFQLNVSTYTLRQFHFHFGCEDEMGSEHSLDGQRFPGEIHFVFTNDKFKDVPQALAQKDGLVALAFFMQYDEEVHNKAMQRITDNIDALRLPKSVADFTADGISLTNLVPAFKENLANLKVFGYAGSLPTPPCLESVIWIVFRRPVKVNHATLETWRNVLQGDYGRMCGNYRPIQKLNTRKIITLIPSVTPFVVDGPTPPPSVSQPPAGVSTPSVPASGASISPSDAVRLRGSSLKSLENVALGPGRTEKAFATLVRDSGKQPDEMHLPADARQELHAEPNDVSKQKAESSLKSQALGASLQKLNPAFAKVPSAKDNNALPESKKGIEVIQTHDLKSVDTGLIKGGAKLEKKPSVAPGMKRRSNV